MKITKIEQQEVEVLVDAICNKCGESCKGSIGNLNGLIEVKISGAYDSSHLGDGEVYQFSLCESCCHQLFATFKHPARQYNYLFPEESMEGTFIIAPLNPISNQDFLDWSEKLKPYMKDPYGYDMTLEPIPKEKSWRVKGNMAALWDLQKNQDLQAAGFLIAQEIS